MKTAVKFLGGFLILLILMVYLASPDKIEMGPAAKAQHEHMQRIKRYFNPDGSHKTLVALVKQNMHNPKSFEHVETQFVDRDGRLALYMKYRGTNAFGAIVTNDIAATADYNGNVKIVE